MLSVSALLSLTLSSVMAAPGDFTVRNIIVKGNHRLNTATIFSYMPIHIGQKYTADEGDAIIQTLYKTGFFDNVNLMREGKTLVVSVQERPTIGFLDISGNKAIKTKQLYKVLKRMGLTEGGVYDSSKLNQIRLGLQNEYSRLGHYVAIVNVHAKPEPRQQVALYISVTEGPIAKVSGISFTGNNSFSDHKLKDTFTLTTPGIFTIFNHHDRFSNQQLDADLSALRNFYYDHGYLRFKVLSKQVKFNENHTKVAIHVNVSEGPVYRISGYNIAEHDAYINKVRNFIDLKKGDVFSRSHIVEINKLIANFFADRGYAFPEVQPVPTLDNKNNTVYITFHISIGERTYVRNINIIGNARTSGRVIRTEFRQMEDAVYSRSKIDESTRRIRTDMPYLTNVSETPSPVAGHPDQLDLDYHVKEVNAGRAGINGGYSDMYGFMYGANLSEPNFMGTGRYVSLGFNRSKYSSMYSFGYNNPFYTIDGVGRGFNISYSHTTPGKVNLESYTMNDFGINFNYSIPMTEYSVLTLGGAYDNIDISDVNGTSISPSITQFLKNHPAPYNQFSVNAGISYQTLDRAIFPLNGSVMQLNATFGPPIGKTSLGYYILTSSAKWFYEFGDSGFVFEPHATLGFGDGIGSTGRLPFFYNFSGGGISSLPGFGPNTLGPKNPKDTTQAMGGNMEIFAGLNLFAPTMFSDRVRLGAIFNIGNIFDTNHITSTPKISYENANFSNLRMSAGAMVSWWWPLGAPIDFSLAFPLNKKPGDESEVFGFSMGGSL